MKYSQRLVRSLISLSCSSGLSAAASQCSHQNSSGLQVASRATDRTGSLASHNSTMRTETNTQAHSPAQAGCAHLAACVAARARRRRTSAATQTTSPHVSMNETNEASVSPGLVGPGRTGLCVHPQPLGPERSAAVTGPDHPGPSQRARAASPGGSGQERALLRTSWPPARGRFRSPQGSWPAVPRRCACSCLGRSLYIYII